MDATVMAKQRRDADRRVRQCERFARLIRITRLLLGHGRWGPDDLAKEIGCSPRTIYRDIQTLSMAGIPVHFDKNCQAYRVPEGFRFPGMDSRQNVTPEFAGSEQFEGMVGRIERFVAEGESFLGSLRALSQSMRELTQNRSRPV